MSKTQVEEPRPLGKILTALIPPMLLGVVAAALSCTHTWPKVRITSPVTWLDLRAVTSAADCVASYPGWSFSGSESCDPMGRPLNYPSAWPRVLAALGIGTQETEPLAWSLLVISVLSVAAVSLLATGRSGGGWPTVALSLSVVAPPVLLLVQRGNIDQVVFGMVVAAVAAAIGGWWRWAGVLLGVATAAKLFPAGGLLSLPAWGRLTRGPMLLGAGVACVLLIPTIPELPLIRERTPTSILSSFGAPVVPMMVMVDPADGRAVPWIAGVLVFLLVLGVLAILARSTVGSPIRLLLGRVAEDSRTMALVVIPTGVFIAAYLAGTNWDYRLVFLLPVMAGLGRLASSGDAPARALVVALVAQMWATNIAPMPVQVASDLLWVVLAPALAGIAIGAARQRRASNADTDQRGGDRSDGG